MKFMVLNLGSGWVFTTIYLRVFTIILFSIGLFIIFQNIEKTKKLKFIWVFLIGAGPGFGVSFIEPIYQEDYGIASDPWNIENIQTLEAASDYQFNNSYNLLVFGTTSCPHCKLTVRKLADNTKAGQTIRVSTFFSGSESRAISYLKENDASKFDHHMIPDDSTFFSFSGNAFPSVFLLDKDGSTKYHWTGDKINYTALDLFVELSEE